MVFINSSTTLGLILRKATINVTGDLYLTLLLLVIFIIAFAMMFKIPFELTSIFILPMLIIGMAYLGNFYSIAGILLIYLSAIITKILFLNG